MISRRRLLITGAGASAALAVGLRPGLAAAAPQEFSAGTVIGWNKTLLRIVRTPGAQLATVHNTRSFAMMHAAVYDGVHVATRSGHRASPVAAAAQAAHDVLIALYPKQAADLDRQLAEDLAGVADPDARRAGVRLGRLVARRWVHRRADDGSSATPPVLPPGTEPGQYRPTPPNFTPPVFTHWAAVTPFVLDSADQFRPDPFPALTDPSYIQAINEVRDLGQDSSTTRTPDQTVQARFWSAPIQNYWNEITQALTKDCDLHTASRVFARLGVAIADTVIAFYEAKYFFLIWRPITAIRVTDPNWTSLVTTPADPSYPGAHSVVSAAAAVILSDEFGPARQLSVSSEVAPGVVREFNSFRDVETEAGLSRIYAGVHTRLDHVSGEALGSDIAQFVLDNY